MESREECRTGTASTTRRSAKKVSDMMGGGGVKLYQTENDKMAQNKPYYENRGGTRAVQAD